MLALGAWSPEAGAREASPSGSPHRLDISATNLPDAIAELAREAHVSIGTDGALPLRPTPRLREKITVGEALARLLAGSGYVAREVSERAWRVERAPVVRATPAAPAAPPPEAPPEPIVVTATKQPLDLLSLPAAVSVVGVSRLEIGTPRDASATVASRIDGLSLTSLGPGRNRMFLRGVADSAFGGESQSTVAVVLDEARLTYAAPDPDIRLVDMERVEVLKGPQGSLYGTGALGGIYRMVSHSAELDETSLSTSAGGTLVAHGGTGYSLSSIVNLPLVPETAALRLVGYDASEPGWVDTGSRHNANNTRVSGARAELGLAVTAGWRLDLTGFGQWLESRDSRYVYTPRVYERAAQLAEPHDNDLSHVAGRLTGKLGGVDIMLAGAITLQKVDDTLDATVGAESFGLADPQTLLDHRRYRTSDSELRLRGRLGGIGWLAGITHLDARQSVVMTLFGLSNTSLPVDDDRRDSHDTAAYFDLTVPLTGRLSLDGGARLFDSSVREIRPLPSGLVTESRHKAGITPSLALAWQPDEAQLVYLRYGSAFRQGGMDITSGGTIDTLKSDELASIEAGWRRRMGDDGNFELSIWYSRWDNVQSDILLDNGLVETTNAGDAAILGIEGSADIRLTHGWRLEVGANVTDAHLTRDALGFELKDRRLPVVPDYTLRGAVRHDFRIAGLDAWARAGLRYVGPARMSFDPAIDRHMGNLIESELEMHVTRGAWQMSLSAQNLLGDKGNVFAFGNALRYRTMDQYSPQQPTTVSLGVTAQM